MKTPEVPDYMQLLPADLQARFARREFAIHGVVRGPRTGSYRSPSFGASTEFAEHREYSPGDDPRSVDWRVFGKQDRYCVKQYVEETNVRATILLDSSASMKFVGESAVSDANLTSETPLAFGGNRRGGNRNSLADAAWLNSTPAAKVPSKFHYGRQLAALLSYLFIRRGDSAGLLMFDSGIRTFLPALGTVAHLRCLLQALHQSQPQAASDTASVLHEAAERIPRRGLVIVISDFLTDVPQLLKSLHHLRHRLHDVVLFHVLSEEELTFPFSDVTRFCDPEECVDEIDVDPPAIRKAYLQQFHQYLAELEKGCQRIPCDYVRFSTARPFETDLSYYLAKRAGG